jgi:hypothetical protein
VRRPGQLADGDPGEPGLLRVDDRKLLGRAALISSVTRVMSRPSSGKSRNPSASASAITWNMPP